MSGSGFMEDGEDDELEEFEAAARIVDRELAALGSSRMREVGSGGSR